MFLKYKNAQSSEQYLPGGGPQGVTLGLLMFLVEVNDAGMDLPQNLLSQSMLEMLLVPLHHQQRQFQMMN